MDLTVAVRLILAAILGGVLGIERQIREKPAGLRTNILICVGSALFMSISTKVAQVVGGDPTRIAAQIITGIGFLGAGAVLHSHGFVSGLTTAATIWVVAGVGMALGSGMYSVAIFTTVMSFLTLYFLARVEDRLQGRKPFSYVLTVTDLHHALPSINRVLEENSASAVNFNFERDASHQRIWFTLLVSRQSHIRIMQQLSEIPDITQVETNSVHDGGLAA